MTLFVPRKYADRIREATLEVSDERACAFREAFAISPWGSNGWDLHNIKQALAVSDDLELVGIITAHLADQESTSHAEIEGCFSAARIAVKRSAEASANEQETREIRAALSALIQAVEALNRQEAP